MQPTFRWGLLGVLILVSFAVAGLDTASIARSLWPAFVAVVGIIATGNAIAGLGAGVLAGGILLAGGVVFEVPRLVLHGHVFPAAQGPWRIGAIAFTLILGAFAGLLERSGGFETLLRRFLSGAGARDKQLLGGAYVVGLLCFFDGLASTLLAGRLAMPLADRSGVSRERLAWVVDSTGSPVACVAFISTWIATQLSLIDQGLGKAPFPVDPYLMFFQSLPANAYCWLALLLVPVAIAWGYQPRAMRRFQPRPPAGTDEPVPENVPLRVVLIPLAALIGGIMGGFPLFHGAPVDVLSGAGWRAAFGGDAGPYALVAGSLLGLIVAFACFPAARRVQAAPAAILGAGALLPALAVLVLAWSLGSMFEALGAAKHIAALLAGGAGIAWLPLAVFFLGCGMAFCTGTSWGTMGLLMPLALPATLVAGQAAGMAPAELQATCAMVIGAVFGGATFGDHCSPFSDTTIVSALASGCTTPDHVRSQLPLAGLAAAAASAAYAMMAGGVPSWAATGVAAVGMVVAVHMLAGRPAVRPAA